MAYSKFELVLLPDRRISFKVAKKYKEGYGKKVYEMILYSDKDLEQTIYNSLLMQKWIA